MKPKVFIGLLAGVALAAGLFVWVGVFNVSAAEKHWKITTQLLEVVRERSIHVRSKDITVPSLEEVGMLSRGARNFSAMCAQCHLAPGMEETELSLGLYPAPPAFYRSEHGIHDPAATFWTIKNGLKLTGMPAWGAFHADQQIWELVAFLSKLKGMTEEEYRSLVGEDGHSRKTNDHFDEQEESHQH
jgi:mono/diheme cytochrome c family protein